jgi:hypothetical protein
MADVVVRGLLLYAAWCTICWTPGQLDDGNALLGLSSFIDVPAWTLRCGALEIGISCVSSDSTAASLKRTPDRHVRYIAIRIFECILHDNKQANDMSLLVLPRRMKSERQRGLSSETYKESEWEIEGTETAEEEWES